MPLPRWRFRRLVVVASALAFIFICAAQWSYGEIPSEEHGYPLLARYVQSQTGKGGGESRQTAMAIPAVRQSRITTSQHGISPKNGLTIRLRDPRQSWTQQN